MSDALLIILVVCFLILTGLGLPLIKRHGNDEESHVRVGKKWLTMAEYNKRFSLK